MTNVNTLRSLLQNLWQTLRSMIAMIELIRFLVCWIVRSRSPDWSVFVLRSWEQSRKSREYFLNSLHWDSFLHPQDLEKQGCILSKKISPPSLKLLLPPSSLLPPCSYLVFFCRNRENLWFLSGKNEFERQNMKKDEKTCFQISDVQFFMFFLTYSPLPHSVE